MAGQPSLRILIIDDEPGFAGGLARLLSRDGATVETASDGQAALAQLHAQRYDGSGGKFSGVQTLRAAALGEVKHGRRAWCGQKNRWPTGGVRRTECA